MAGWQLDIKTAFLNGYLEEDVYTVQPPGYEQGGPNVACHLRRSLYGLRQAPRAWYVRLRTALEEMGFKPSKADPGMFVKEEKGEPVYVLVYVDDLLIACKSSVKIARLKAQLKSLFDVRDLGESSFYLGFEIKRDRAARTLHISQKRFVSELLDKFGLKGANPRAIPMEKGLRLTSEGEPLDTARFPYAELVGGLLYLSVCSRPDISYAVGALARHMSKPTVDHWNVAKGVLRYLAGSAEVGISYKGGGGELLGFCDASFADAKGRKSTSGYVFVLGGGAISWASKVQPTVAMSTAESEYIAAAATVKESLWLRHLLYDLGIRVGAVPLRSDNSACISLMESPISSARTKHIDICHHFARERVERGEIRVVYCKTSEQVAMFSPRRCRRQS